jgi:AAA+ ATPase superfamily predicted ATPase
MAAEVGMALERPSDLFDRDTEWSQLADFVTETTPGLRVGIVSGRRRQGKSYLLRRLTRAVGGLYHQAQEVERLPALARFAGDVADGLALARTQLHFPDWETALRTALGYPERGSTQARDMAPSGPGRMLVLDELPYLLAHSPEIPSVLQELHDESRDRSYPPAAVIVCGSTLSIMSDLLSGTKPLRGRAQLDMAINQFDYLTAARYWGIDNPQVAFVVHTIFGGTAGYKPLVRMPVPASYRQLPRWLGTNVLNPAHALFNEKDYLLREDNRISDKRLYNSIISSVASGNHTPKAIGQPIGRDTNYLRHPLETLVVTGFLKRVEDMLSTRRPLYFLADPIVRFTEIVIDPYRPLLEEADVEGAWKLAEPAYSSQIMGLHFEQIACNWTAYHSSNRWDREPIGEVGPAVISDPAGKTQHQVDIVALARGERRASPNARVALLGEAKASNQRRSLADLLRLEHIRDLLVRRGYQASAAQLVVFGRAGCKRDLVTAAANRADVHLVDLKDLYAG